MTYLECIPVVPTLLGADLRVHGEAGPGNEHISATEIHSLNSFITQHNIHVTAKLL